MLAPSLHYQPGNSAAVPPELKRYCFMLLYLRNCLACAPRKQSINWHDAGRRVVSAKSTYSYENFGSYGQAGVEVIPDLQALSGWPCVKIWMCHQFCLALKCWIKTCSTFLCFIELATINLTVQQFENGLHIEHSNHRHHVEVQSMLI